MPTTQEMLDEAETALHQLQIGAAKVMVWYENTRVEFTPAKRVELERYIARLKAKLSGKRVARSRVRYGIPD